MVVNGPSPKKRRTDNLGPVSAESIAQSNAHVQVVTGNLSRQSRWMQGTTAITSHANGEVTEQVERNPSAGINTAAFPQNNNAAAQSSTASSSRMSPESVRAGNVGPWSNVSTMADQAGEVAREEGASLVDYESPYSVRAQAVAPSEEVQSGRKSLNAQARPATSRQGLPSPAPSDENNINSPIIVSDGSSTTANAPRPAARPRISSGQASSPATPTSQSPAMIQVQSAQIQAQQLLQQYQPRPGRRRQSSISVPAPVRNSPRLPTQTNAPSPLQHQHPLPTPTLPSNAPPGMPGVQHAHFYQTSVGGGPPVVPSTPTRQTPPQSPASRHLGHFYNPRVMHAAIDAQIQRLGQIDSAGNKLRNDHGRLSLLREAVNKGDWFYVVLSQLFCLRSTFATNLPRSVKAIPQESWRQLEALLCENNTLLPLSVSWFSDFPFPIMDVYSYQDQAFRVAYEAQVRTVSDFLTKLPQQWPRLTWESTQRQAPPLVQDMVEQMSLSSPVLQTTAFRAIARLFWVTAQSPDVESGIESLVSLHQLDQSLYFTTGKRLNGGQKRQAYGGYREVFNEWKRYDETLRAQVAPHAHHHMRQQSPFQLPPNALASFGLPVPIAPQRPQQPQNLPHQAHQRHNSIPHSARLTPNQQQQAMMQTQQQAYAQQQAWSASSSGNHNQSRAPLAAQSPQIPPGVCLPGPPQPPPRNPRAIVPPREICNRPQPTHPDGTRSALHQAHLRSPTLGAAKVAGALPKLYRQVEACVLSPIRILKDEPIQSIPFHVELSSTDLLPQSEDQVAGKTVRATVTEDSRMYRLRCAVINNTTGFPTISSWIEADNVWPETVYFAFNGTPLETRRKLQHGRYMPINVTHLVRPGDNELKIAVNRLSQDKSAFDFAVAVEVVGVMSHRSIVNGLRMISAEESLNAIKRSLSSGQASDDDVMLVSSTMTIKLFDPISGSKIFDSPVRGESCLHRDPFDLETFLSTCKRPTPDAPSVVDTWRCPICRKDVRPQTLIKDGFLVRVREELAAKGLLDTRAILINADGSWKAKEEERTGVRSASLEREERAGLFAAAGIAKAKKPAPVVIELD